VCCAHVLGSNLRRSTGCVAQLQQPQPTDRRRRHVLARCDHRPWHRGELWFRVGRREIGHLHGDAAAHFGFPRHVWITLRKQGRIEPHPVFVDLVGPAARRIQTEGDVQAVIDLLRLNYERLTTLAGAGSS